MKEKLESRVYAIKKTILQCRRCGPMISAHSPHTLDNHVVSKLAECLPCGQNIYMCYLFENHMTKICYFYALSTESMVEIIIFRKIILPK